MTNKEAAELRERNHFETATWERGLFESSRTISSMIDDLREIKEMLDNDCDILNGDAEGETFLEKHEAAMMKETIKGIASMVYHVKGSFRVR